MGWVAEVLMGGVRYVKQVEQVCDFVSVDGKPICLFSVAVSEEEFKLRVTEVAKITFWHVYRFKEKAVLKQVMKRFADLNSFIKVKLQGVFFDVFNDKIKIVLFQGRGFDFFIFVYDVFGVWSEMGFLEFFNQWIFFELVRDFIFKIVNVFVYKNAFYGLFMVFKCVVLYYNKVFISALFTIVDEFICLAK